MPLILTLEQVTEEDRNLVGGKGLSLAMLAKAGFHVPQSLCVSTDAYRTFVADHGLAKSMSVILMTLKAESKINKSLPKRKK